MRKHLILLLAALLFVVGCKKDSESNPAAAAATTGTISGKVTIAAGDSVIAGAAIVTSPATSTVQSDAQGLYTINNVAAGAYTITATKNGISTGNTVVTVASGQNATGNIKMGVIVNRAPNAPVLILPAAGVSGQECTMALNWSCADADSDKLTYDVYMDKTSLPTTKVASGLTTTSFPVANLDSASIYYWKVIATDSKGAVSEASPVYSFVTKVLLQGLLAYYPFNGNLKDMSGNSLDGSGMNAALTADRFSFQNRAYYFNGNSYITTPEQSIAGITTLTVSAWVKFTGNNSGTIVYKGTKSGEFRLGLDNGKALFVVGLSNNTFPQVTSTTTLAVNRTYLLTARYTRGSKIEIFVNGNLENTQTIAALDLKQTNATSSSIGAYNFNSVFSQFFNGNIDDVRIYGRLLSDAEIKALFKEGGWSGI